MCNLAKTVPEEHLGCHKQVYVELAHAAFSAYRTLQNLMQFGNLEHELWKRTKDICCFEVKWVCNENL